jgi:hypothetical protein
VVRHVLTYGILKLSVLYLHTRKSGLHFYHRRIPEDVRGHYPGNKRFVRESLRTHALPEAVDRIRKLVKRDDAYWRILRSTGGDPAAHAQNLEDARALLAT